MKFDLLNCTLGVLWSNDTSPVHTTKRSNHLRSRSDNALPSISLLCPNGYTPFDDRSSNPSPFTITKDHPNWYHDIPNVDCIQGVYESAPESLAKDFKIFGSSEHFDLRWDSVKHPNLLSEDETKDALDRMERIYQWFINPPVNFLPLFCNSDKKYKFIIHTDPSFGFSGAGQDIPNVGEVPVLWVDPSALISSDDWHYGAAVHEFTHGMQMGPIPYDPMSSRKRLTRLEVINLEKRQFQVNTLHAP